MQCTEIYSTEIRNLFADVRLLVLDILLLSEEENDDACFATGKGFSMCRVDFSL